MKIDRIRTDKNQLNTEANYTILFDDEYSIDVDHEVIRTWGHTMEKIIDLRASCGHRSIGSTHRSEHSDGRFKYSNENTIDGNESEKLIDRLEFIKESHMVKGEKTYGQKYYELDYAASSLINFYNEERQQNGRYAHNTSDTRYTHNTRGYGFMS